ncbi:MAG: OmpA family protein [Planctomycetes bacterium]|nr:OmpA family protein [Planctomycetota bacterium]
MRKLAFLASLGVLAAGLSSCSLTELRNTNRRLKEANDRLVSENNRLEQELAASQRELGQKDKEAAQIKDQSDSEIAPSSANPPPRIKMARAEDNSEFKDMGLETRTTAQGTWVSLPDQVFFPLGQASLSSQGRSILDKVARLINTKYRGQMIRVDGHTDDLPVRKVRHLYPSNWELSTARACAVVRYLVEEGKVAPQRIYPAGHSYFKPKVTNSSSTARSKNRRVEILIAERDV